VYKNSPTNLNIESNYYPTIANFLKKQFNAGAKFLLLTSSKDLKEIRFDPSQLDTEEGKEFVDFLLMEEMSGSTILMSHPRKGLKEVSFLEDE